MKSDLKKVFAKVLKQLRKDRKLSQQALADYCGLERVYISKLERGISMPSIETIFRIAEVLKLKPQELVEQLYKHFK
ncbi:MAG: helix-turn-helix transcriptional regulator [Bacteroidetes bacterium]|nr:helix-turn-helix transcriptional regulator [Bacteroidota bacterium]